MPYSISVPAFLLAAAILGTSVIGNAMTGHDAGWIAEMAQMR